MVWSQPNSLIFVSSRHHDVSCPLATTSYLCTPMLFPLYSCSFSFPECSPSASLPGTWIFTPLLHSTWNSRSVSDGSSVGSLQRHAQSPWGTFFLPQWPAILLHLFVAVFSVGLPGSSNGRSLGEGVDYPLQYSWASLVAQMVKNLPAMQETWVQSLG